MADHRLVDLTRIATELGLARESVQSVIRLLDEGNTVPFITRYRKEQTGSLDEEQIGAIRERVAHERQLCERTDTILRLIDAQGKLTPELRQNLLTADSLKRLDDLYLPFRPKRRTKGALARERGLGPLAERLLAGEISEREIPAALDAAISPANDLPDRPAVLAGTRDLVAELLGDDPEVRAIGRELAWKRGRICSSAKRGFQDDTTEYRDYLNFAEAVSRIPPHRVLALNRGEQAGALRVWLDWEEDQVLDSLMHRRGWRSHPAQSFLRDCLQLALERFVHPSLEREVRRDLTQAAEEQALRTFQRNLRNLLLQPPLKDQPVLALDPGFRTGCKVAVLDRFGSPVEFDVVSLLDEAKRSHAINRLAAMVERNSVKVIAIGNGTACRESEELVSRLIRERCPECRYVVVNEAGASIYSTSLVAREEFPDLDATARGTVSIGRRLQDPLSELVKIDPQHLGVGMYQHDVSATGLRESLDGVVVSCVNFVGVDLNRASSALLQYVSGLNQLIARRVVAWRLENGPFRNRRDLLKVQGVGPTTFQQAAGFLRIDGDEPLDRTAIHPESYDAARSLLASIAADPREIGKDSSIADRLRSIPITDLAGQLAVGVPTLSDIVDSLCRPERDPRGESADVVFREGVLGLDDLEVGMEVRGAVLNVVDFGAFVDIGLKDSALIHVSQMSTQFVRSTHDIVRVGDIVQAWVLSIDRPRKRVGLTLIPPGAEN